MTQTLKEFNEYLVSMGFQGTRPYEHDFTDTGAEYKCTKCGFKTQGVPMFFAGDDDNPADEIDDTKCPPRAV